MTTLPKLAGTKLHKGGPKRGTKGGAGAADLTYEVNRGLHDIAKEGFGRLTAGKFVAELVGGKWSYSLDGEPLTGEQINLDVQEMYPGLWNAAANKWRGPCEIRIE